jgi:hypothetical protein
MYMAIQTSFVLAKSYSSMVFITLVPQAHTGTGMMSDDRTENTVLSL